MVPITSAGPRAKLTPFLVRVVVDRDVRASVGYAVRRVVGLAVAMV
jgi:hypothetical protein